MVITQSQGNRPISRTAAKDAIKTIIDNNAAIRSAVDTLVAYGAESTLLKRRERAILSVYEENAVFSEAVDTELNKL
jgi:hypothetical protein